MNEQLIGDLFDGAFYGTILAMIALLFGHPVAAVFIFLIGVLL